jgi:hypothetical protein
LNVLIGILGVLLIMMVNWDLFETVILPRRVMRRFRLTRWYYAATGGPIAALAPRIRNSRRRETFLSYFGPLLLILLLVFWIVSLIFGYAMIQWSLGSQLAIAQGGSGFGTDLYVSGTTLLTLGLGDVVPTSPPARFLTVLEVGNGFGVLAIVIGYLPILYQAFSSREAKVSTLDARAGSPPSAVEFLRRFGNSDREAVNSFLREWELWAAELMEAHLSYPVLAYYRSQHDNQSWLAGLTMILDLCTLYMVGIEDEAASDAARLTFAMARHAAVDLAQVMRAPISQDLSDRLPPEGLQCLREVLAESGLRLRDGTKAEQKFMKLRGMYEPYVAALSQSLLTPLPPWNPPPEVSEYWKRTL